MFAARTATLLALAALAAPDARAQAPSCSPFRASLTPAGGQLSQGATTPSLSEDGRFLAFVSAAPELHPQAVRDQAIWRDLETGRVVIASLTPGGAPASSDASAPRLDPAGRRLGFLCAAGDLVSPPVPGGLTRAWVHDVRRGTTELVSRNALGQPADGSAFDVLPLGDGRTVVFSAAASNVLPGTFKSVIGLYAIDLVSNTVELVSRGNGVLPANGHSIEPSASRDGRFVAFSSEASNLVANDTNGEYDCFLLDRATGTVERVSVGFNGAQGNGLSVRPSVSDDGRFVAFTSTASNWDNADTNGAADIYVRDRVAGTATRVSLGPGGVQGNNNSDLATISGDGALVTFNGLSGNWFPNPYPFFPDYGAYTVTRATGEIVRLSEDLSGAPTRLAQQPVMSSDGTRGAFITPEALLPDDTNGVFDVYVSGTSGPGPILRRYCTAKVNSLGCTPVLEADGCSSASATSGFTVRCRELRNQQSGVFLYGRSGRAALPFGGGTLCLAQPFDRTGLAPTGGTPGALDCSGVLSIDMNAFASGALGGRPLPALSVPGQVFQVQAWATDPTLLDPDNRSLSAAFEFVVGS